MRTPSAGASGVIIETERLRIRAHRDDDLADLMALAGNWEIARWVGTIPHPYSVADGREWITRVQENHSTGRPPLRNRAEGNRPPDRRRGARR